MRMVQLVALLLLGACAELSNSAGRAGKPGLDIADVALVNGAPQTALNVARQVLADDPKNPPALLREAQAELALGQQEQAADSYRRALAAAPNNTDAALGLGRLQLDINPAAAAALFTRVVSEDPKNVAALTDLGIASDLLGKHSAAQAAYRRALSIDPGRIAASSNLGLSLALSGGTTEAIAILRPLAEVPGASARVRQNLAAALVLSGDAVGATAILRADMPQDQVLAAIAGYRSLGTSSP